ncbi:hypothetical protein ACUXTG_001533 [Staphylococcus capitis]
MMRDIEHMGGRMMEKHTLSLDLLNNRLNQLVHIHNDLHEEANQTLDEKEPNNIIYIKNATLILIKLYLYKLSKNKARYGKTTPQDSLIHILNDKEAYYAFHEFNCDIEIEELALTPNLEKKYEEDALSLLNIRGKLTPFMDINEDALGFEIFNEDITLVMRNIIKNNDGILIKILEDDYRIEKLDEVIKRAFIDTFQKKSMNDKASNVAEKLISDS